MRLLPWKRDTYTPAQRERILDEAEAEQRGERAVARRRVEALAEVYHWRNGGRDRYLQRLAGPAVPDHRGPQRSGS